MITTPKTYCPLCGTTLTVLKPIRTTRYDIQVTYLCMCSCGQSELTVRHNKILSVELLKPEKYPDFRILGGSSALND